MTNFLGLVFVAFLCCAASGALAQTPTASVDCVQQLMGATNCPGGWLRNLGSATAGNYVTVGSYFKQGDNGGGIFEAGAAGSCATIPATAVGGTSAGSSTVTISYSGPVAPAAGMSVNSSTSNAILPYDIITNVSGPVITLETPVSKTLGSVALIIGPDNGGSVIADAETPARCFYRSSSQYTPNEWGAHEDGVNDDTVPLQSWMNTGQSFILGPTQTSVNQSHIAVAGPASQAAISIISQPLTCPAGTTIQGPTNLDVYSNTPLFTIEASRHSFPSSSAVLDAYDYCRISGIALNGNTVADSLDIYGAHVTVDGFSALESGSPYNLNCSLGGHVVGLQVKDSTIENAVANGTAGSGTNIYIQRNCDNYRLISDIVRSAADVGIHDAGVEGTIADGVVEESQGVGIDLDGAWRASVGAMHIQGSGLGSGGGAAIAINNAQTISICNNHLEGNGGDVSYSAQVHFSGTSDNIELCSNVYEPQNFTGAEPPPDVALRPLYAYSAAPGTVLTNTHLYESPAPRPPDRSIPPTPP